MAGPDRKRRHKHRDAGDVIPEPTRKAPQSLMPGERGAWPVPGFWKPENRLYTMAVLILAALLFWALWSLAPERSFHQDELAVLAVEKRADEGIILERQHQLYHVFYQWWLRDAFDEQHARLPSMVFVTLGLIALAGLAGRLFGARTAFLAALVYTLWPRTWDDGLEMRYYAFVFLCSVLALHAYLSVLRGRLAWPLPALGILLVIVVRWHATAIPLHAGLLTAAVLLFVARLYRMFRESRQARARIPVAVLMIPAVLLPVTVVGAILMLPILQQETGVDRITNRISRVFSEGNFNPIDLVRWLWGWVDDRYAPDFFFFRILRFTFPALVFGGFYLAWRRDRWLVYTWLALFGIQVLLAGVFALGWTRLAIGYKYMTSFSPFLLIAVAASVDWCLRWMESRKSAVAYLAPAAVVLLYAAPIVPRVLVSARGDGSHLREVWTTILSESDGVAPIVYSNATVGQSLRPYTYLLENMNLTYFSSYVYTEEIVPAFMTLGRPVFYCTSPNYAADPADLRFMDEVAVYRSNFTPTWDVRLMRSPDAMILAPGMAVELNDATPIMALEAASWIVNGEMISLKAGERLTLAPDSPQARMIPAMENGRYTRPAGYVNAASIDEDNRPVITSGKTEFQLSAVLSLDYDLYIPPGPCFLEIAARSGHSGPEAVIISTEGRFIGIYVAPSDNTRRTGFSWFIPLPASLGDTISTCTITRLYDSPHYLDSGSAIESLFLESLRVHSDPAIPPSPNALESYRMGPAPQWLIAGELDLSFPGTEELWSLDFLQGEKSDIRVTHGDEGTRIALPAEMESALVYLPPFVVEPGTLLVPEIEWRARNLIRRNAVLSIHYFNSEGAVTGTRVIGERPLNWSDPVWTRRLGAVEVPESAALGLIGVYINAPPSRRVRDDAVIEIRRIRFLEPNF